MKTLFTLFAGTALVLSACKKDNTNFTKDYSGNRLVMLQVDYKTFNFEGGKEFTFDEDTDEFTLKGIYQSPGDFGGVKLYYDELDELLFEGSVIWMGTGKRSFPKKLDKASDFKSFDSKVSMPDNDLFTGTFEGLPTTEFTDSEKTKIWKAIDDLKLVSAYRELNPDGKVNIYLYRRSVGIGDPAEWDWLVFLKN